MTRTVVQDDRTRTAWEGQWSLSDSAIVRQRADCTVVDSREGLRHLVEFWNDDWFEMDHGGHPGIKDRVSFRFPLNTVLVVCEVEL